MIKGCSKIFFFGVIIIAALYYIFTRYEIYLLPQLENNIKVELVDKMIAALTDKSIDLKIDGDRFEIEELKNSLMERAGKFDTKAIKKFYSDFSEFLSDDLLDSEELKKLKEYLDNYERRTKN